jgi:hypothetical protein
MVALLFSIHIFSEENRLWQRSCQILCWFADGTHLRTTLVDRGYGSSHVKQILIALASKRNTQMLGDEKAKVPPRLPNESVHGKNSLYIH